MAEVYKKEEQKHGNPAETAGSKEESPTRNLFAQNNSISAVPIRTEKDPPKQESKPLPAMLEIKDESYQKIKVLFEAKVAELAAGDKKKAELVSTKLDALFGVLKADGELKLRYDPQPEEIMKKRATRTSQEVLDSHGGDCKELSMLFVVCANRLGLEGTEADMLIMKFHIKDAAPGSEPPRHAALITTKGGSYLIDPAMLSAVKPIELKDPSNVRSSEISDFYTSLGVVPNVGQIKSVEITRKATTISEMLSINLMETGEVLREKLKMAPASEKEPLRLQLISVLESAYEADEKNRFAQSRLILGYSELADEAFGKGEQAQSRELQSRYFELAKHYCEKAITLYEKCKQQYEGIEKTDEIVGIKKNAAHAHFVAHQIYRLNPKEVESAISELDKICEIYPKNGRKYRDRANFLYDLAGEENAGGPSEKEKGYLLRGKKGAEQGLEEVKGNPSAESSLREIIKKFDEKLEKFAGEK